MVESIELTDISLFNGIPRHRYALRALLIRSAYAPLKRRLLLLRLLTFNTLALPYQFFLTLYSG